MPRPKELVTLFGLATMEASVLLALLVGIDFVRASGPALRPEDPGEDRGSVAQPWASVQSAG
jgi:hypothetical protein